MVTDTIAKSAYYVALVITLSILALLWLNFSPQILNTIPSNSSTYTQIKTLGNQFFLNETDAVLVTIYFIFVAAMFLSAIAIGGSPLALPIGFVLGIIAIIISLPLSDAAHAILYNPQFVPATQHYPGTLYILDHLPELTAIEILIYMLFASVLAERVRTALGLQPGGTAGGGSRLYKGD